jgi:hypothetical protein
VPCWAFGFSAVSQAHNRKKFMMVHVQELQVRVEIHWGGRWNRGVLVILKIPPVCEPVRIRAYRGILEVTWIKATQP